MKNAELQKIEFLNFFSNYLNGYSNLKGVYSRRINYYNRLIYTTRPNEEGLIDENGELYEGIVLVHRSWEHDYDPPKKRASK